MDFFRSEENPNLLHYLLVLWGSMFMLWIHSMPSMPKVLCRCLLVGMYWACPLTDMPCACPLSLLILRSGVLKRTVCTGPELLNKAIQYLRKVLTKCKCPNWALDKVERKFINNNLENSNTQGDNTQDWTDRPSSNSTGRSPPKID